MNKQPYIIIYDWMIKELGDIESAYIYAIISHFSNKESRSVFFGGVKYLTTRSKVPRERCEKILHHLEAIGAIKQITIQNTIGFVISYEPNEIFVKNALNEQA